MDKFAQEEEAIQAFARLMQAARACRSLFESAGAPLPARLVRFLGDGDARPAVVASPRMVVPRPSMPPKPADYQDDWIWIPVKEVSTTTLVLCVLRAAKEPLTAKDIAREISALGGEANMGTIFNIGTRLDGKEIDRSDGGWVLTPSAGKAPVFNHGYVWGPLERFEKQEIAAHRRLLILHVLGVQTDGLQIVQLTRQLESLDWVRTPKTKDLIKMDLKLLGQLGKVKKGGGKTGKWSVAGGKDTM